VIFTPIPQKLSILLGIGTAEMMKHASVLSDPFTAATHSKFDFFPLVAGLK
jgi:hypothetical protein